MGIRRRSNKLVVTLPQYLKGKLERVALEYDCSQAEVLRTAFIRMMEADR